MKRTFQTIVGFHAGAWDPDMVMSRLLEASMSATLTTLPEQNGSVIALSMGGYFDDARKALARQLEAQGFKTVWWSEMMLDGSEILEFSSGTFKLQRDLPFQLFGVGWAPIASEVVNVRTVLAPDTGKILLCSAAKKPQVSELVGITKIFRLED